MLKNASKTQCFTVFWGERAGKSQELFFFSLRKIDVVFFFFRGTLSFFGGDVLLFGFFWWEKDTKHGEALLYL